MKKIIITEKQLENILLETNNTDVYFDTFSAAVQHARQHTELRGFEIDEDDWWREVSVGDGRPKEGRDTRITVGLIKNGIPQKKSLHIQVYNRGLKYKNNYELNFYIL